MKIKTITCHDVYNVGASLQAYALQTYLTTIGHDVEIINYKPDYLKHYRLWWVPNPRFDKPFVRTIYKLAKFPGRLRNRLTDPRKKAFDRFTSQYLKTTEKEYSSLENLTADPPVADIYIAGSDQIWNPVFQNGKDPVFYLEFAPEAATKISYAASFAVDRIPQELAQVTKERIEKLDFVSIREKSGLDILASMGIPACQVCDPVFLLTGKEWKSLRSEPASREPYLLVYDFESNSNIAKACKKYTQEHSLKLVSVFPMEGADLILRSLDPIAFLGAVNGADFVVSNSFHATAFSLIFHKEFVVFNRAEKINTRMRDLLLDMGIAERLLPENTEIPEFKPIRWELTDRKITEQQNKAVEFLETAFA